MKLDANKAIGAHATKRRAVFWAMAVAFTYVAGKLAAGPAMWVTLMFPARTIEDRLILLNYVVSGLFPLLLFAVPAFLCWRWLLVKANRKEVVSVMALELIFLAYTVFPEVQRSVAGYLTP